MISSEKYKQRIRGLVVDEAHTVKKWYVDVQLYGRGFLS